MSRDGHIACWGVLFDDDNIRKEEAWSDIIPKSTQIPFFMLEIILS